MVESISVQSTMQPKTIISVKPTKDIKAREVSEKEQHAVQNDEPHKRDRFEPSGAITKAEAAEVPKTSEAVSESQAAEQTNKTRSFDRLELSDGYLSGLSAADTSLIKRLRLNRATPKRLHQARII